MIRSHLMKLLSLTSQEKRRVYDRNYYRRNKRKILAYQKKNRRDWYDPEKRKDYNRRYWEKNKETLILKSRTDAKHILAALRCSARSRGIFISLVLDEFKLWWEQQAKLCVYCGRSLQEVVGELSCYRLTVDRRNNSKGYVINNLVISCKRCNVLKGDFFTFSDMQKIGPVVRERARNSRAKNCEAREQ